jgi:hypothetical protein
LDFDAERGPKVLGLGFVRIGVLVAGVVHDGRDIVVGPAGLNGIIGVTRPRDRGSLSLL